MVVLIQKIEEPKCAGMEERHAVANEKIAIRREVLHSGTFHPSSAGVRTAGNLRGQLAVKRRLYPYCSIRP